MSYAQALQHYASGARNDFVKRAWERPQFVLLLTNVLAHIFTHVKPSSTLRVVDIGAGSSEGYYLVRDAYAALGLTPRFHYWAIDNSHEMLALAEKNIGRSDPVVEGRAHFLAADMRSIDYVSQRADLLLSIGAPYSHLQEAEFAIVSSRIFAGMAAHAAPSVAIFDVLGRYSVEWLSLARSRVRQYEMSFFVETPEVPVFPMTFYSRDDLNRVIGNGAFEHLGRRAERIVYWDRSVFAGRHTATGRYNSRFPKIRSLVNALASSDDSNPTNIARELRLVHRDADLGNAPVPAHIANHLKGRFRAWNAAVDLIEDGRMSAAAACEALRAAEQLAQSEGVGAAHSLTACVFAGPGVP